MDGRGFGSGSSDYGMYGGGFGDSHTKSRMSCYSADAVIAKLNEKLDMLSQLEGGLRAGRNNRFDQYESYSDSHPSASAPRDLHRSASFGFAGGQGSFPVSGWASGPRSQPRGGRPDGFGFGSRMQDDFMGGMTSGQGHSRSMRGMPSSLLSNRMYPERDFQFRGSPFGGNQRGNRQQNRKRTRSRQQGKQKERMGGPQSPSDEPESKESRIETTGDRSNNEDTTEPRQEKIDDGTPATKQDSNSAAEVESTEVSEEKGSAKSRRRRGFFERTANNPSRSLTRVTFACSICKFRSFYSEDMESHLESKFHKDHFNFLASNMSKATSEFLKEYLLDKFKKTTQRISRLPDHSATICQVLKDQDLTRDLGMEHFIKKEEAAHCTACDIYIPMQNNLIQQHLKTPNHDYNCKAMMEQSKWSGASVARSILNHKVISKKMETFLKGENPFDEDHDKEDHDDSVTLEETELDAQATLEEGAENQATLEEGAENPEVEALEEGAGNGDQPQDEHLTENQSADGGGCCWAGTEEEEEGVEGIEVGDEEGVECLEGED